MEFYLYFMIIHKYKVTYLFGTFIRLQCFKLHIDLGHFLDLCALKSVSRSMNLLTSLLFK